MAVVYLNHVSAVETVEAVDTHDARLLLRVECAALLLEEEAVLC